MRFKIEGPPLAPDTIPMNEMQPGDVAVVVDPGNATNINLGDWFECRACGSNGHLLFQLGAAIWWSLVESANRKVRVRKLAIGQSVTLTRSA